MTDFETALTATGYKWAHHGFVNIPNETYMVYSEDRIEPLRAGGKQVESITHGVLDLFTRDDSGVPRSTVETQLNKLAGFAFRLDDILFEEETGLIHYAWHWSVV